MRENIFRDAQFEAVKVFYLNQILRTPNIIDYYVGHPVKAVAATKIAPRCHFLLLLLFLLQVVYKNIF